MIVDLLIAIINNTELICENYVSIVTCQEVLETSYLGEYCLMYLNVFAVTNKSHKIKNYMLHWCMYF